MMRIRLHILVLFLQAAAPCGGGQSTYGSVA